MKIILIATTLLTLGLNTSFAYEDQSFQRISSPCENKILSATREQWSRVANNKKLDPKTAPIIAVCSTMCEGTDCKTRIFVEEKKLLGQEDYLYYVSDFVVSSTNYSVDKGGKQNCEVTEVEGVNLSSLRTQKERDARTYLFVSIENLNSERPKFITPSTSTHTFYGINPCTIQQNLAGSH